MNFDVEPIARSIPLLLAGAAVTHEMGFAREVGGREERTRAFLSKIL